MNNKNKEKINIGTITGAVGLKGEMSMFHKADDPEILFGCESFIIDGDIYVIENIRYRKKTPIIKLEGVTDRNAAEAMAKKEIYVEEEDLPDLPEGTYYIKDLTGLKVISADDGTQIGVIKDVIPGSAQDTYEILTEDGKIMLLPAVTEFIIEISRDQDIVKVRLPVGIEDIVYQE